MPHEKNISLLKKLLCPKGTHVRCRHVSIAASTVKAHHCYYDICIVERVVCGRHPEADATDDLDGNQRF